MRGGTGRPAALGSGRRRGGEQRAEAPGLLSGTATPRRPHGGPRSPWGGAVGVARVLWCPLSSQAEVEETLKRIQAHRGVVATMVVNAEGIPIRTTLDNSTTVQYAGLLHQLTMKARSTVRDIDPQNDLTFLRIRSKKHEIMVAPDKEYLLIVIQNPCE
ncbi:dynein light chain roadblock-type 2 isoform X1 [Buteo buteo]|uniref:dynein light chain roadblock-type 2 isoform X1 n=1 Tax=Buteo buteo TaxID=30397 RepID=UPI003EBFAAE2